MFFSFQKTILFAVLLFALNNSLSAQDLCANATLITTDTICSGTTKLTNQTLSGSTSDGYAVTSTCGFLGTAKDIWYKFKARTKTPTITVSNVNLGTGGWKNITNVKIQLLAGSCGSFTEVACTSGVSGTDVSLTPTLLNALAEGTTYYIRIHNNTTTVAANCTFDICVTDAMQKGSRMNEVFSRTVLSPALALNYPWEITYGPDNFLWITESKGYKVYRMDPTTGVKTTVLDISQGSTFLPSADQIFNCQFANGAGAQGGLAGLALHPNFLDGTGSENNSVYISYIYSSNGGTSPTGIFFTNRLVKFNYNKTSGLLESPVSLCDTLPGSSDHNSQRMIIAPVIPGGTKYLFYAQGDMGAGQFSNRDRINKAQNANSYEGKILRFNLVSNGNAGLNAWLPNAPNANPYGATSAVYSIGIRNNQGFAYDTSLNILYGASHGPYSDDEINIIEPSKNYGHPLVIGYAADGNYNGTLTSSTSTSVSAGAAFTDNSGNSACPAIGNEVTRMNEINTANPDSYRDPLFSAYPTIAATIANTWKNNPSNGSWESEAWSGLDIYSNKIIPGWKRSLVAAGLKWGRLIRLPLNVTGSKTLPSNVGGAVGNAGDTITYFQSMNRYRDLAFAPNGKELFLVMDNSSATSGPGSANPTSPACPGCVIKYSFLGYADNSSGFSTISKTIDVTTGTLNTCNSGTPVTIDGTNNFLWVPITGPDGNIMAELNAMGQNLGVVTSSFYKNSGAVREANGKKYLDRNMTITPANIFASPVKVRLYISKTELDALIASPTSGVTSISNLQILKNHDACGGVLSSSTTQFPAANTGTDLVQGVNGYVLQTAVSSFSTFYFAAANIVLPVDLISFNGALQNDLSALLKWKTANEINTAGFNVERSIDGNNFKQIAFLKATGSKSLFDYNYIDKEAVDQQSTVLYYRLQILNNDGSFKYSNNVTITLPVTKAIINIAPNPVLNDVRGTIVSPFTTNVTLRIFDNTGRLMLQTNTFVKKGTNNFTQNINHLATGAYYLDISGNGIISRTKFQKF